jgi:hypothetical protein
MPEGGCPMKKRPSYTKEFMLEAVLLQYLGSDHGFLYYEEHLRTDPGFGGDEIHGWTGNALFGPRH